jgi:hypothetical protein
VGLIISTPEIVLEGDTRKTYHRTRGAKKAAQFAVTQFAVTSAARLLIVLL